VICFIAQIDGTLAVPWPNLWRRAVGDKGMKGADVKVTGMIDIYIYSTHRYTNLFITVTYIHFISFRERNAKKEPVLLEDSEYIYRSKCVEIKCLKSSPSLPPSLALAILQ